MHRFHTYYRLDTVDFLRKLKTWAEKERSFSFYQSNKGSSDPYSRFETLVFCGNVRSNDPSREWRFGYVSYELKDRIESLSSRHSDHYGFRKECFHVPKLIFMIGRNKIKAGLHHSAGNKKELDLIVNDILKTKKKRQKIKSRGVKMRAKIPKSTYISTIKQLRQHISRGRSEEQTS